MYVGDTPVTCIAVVLYKKQAVVHDCCVALSLVLFPVGFEPTIYGLEVRCIIQLCYRNTYRRWDSNPYWTDFKSVVSANWTTAAHPKLGGRAMRPARPPSIKSISSIENESDFNIDSALFIPKSVYVFDFFILKVLF